MTSSAPTKLTNTTIKASRMKANIYKRNSSTMDVAASDRSINPIIEDLIAGSDMCGSSRSSMRNIDSMRTFSSSQESREGELMA